MYQWQVVTVNNMSVFLCVFLKSSCWSFTAGKGWTFTGETRTSVLQRMSTGSWSSEVSEIGQICFM